MPDPQGVQLRVIKEELDTRAGDRARVDRLVLHAAGRALGARQGRVQAHASAHQHALSWLLGPPHRRQHLPHALLDAVRGVARDAQVHGRPASGRCPEEGEDDS